MHKYPCSRRVSPALRQSLHAFTLIELLTVIAIIGILAAIIIPTVGKVRSSARKTQCISNLRQWGTAVRLYANDSKGRILLYNKSGDQNDPNTLPRMVYSPYFSQLYMSAPDGTRTFSQILLSRCPVNTSSPLPAGDPNFRARDYAFIQPTGSKSAAGNTLGVSTDTNKINYYNLSDARSPSQLLLMSEYFDSAPDHELLITTPTEFTTYVKPMQTNSATPSLVRHGGSANVLFLDGHVSSLNVTQTDSSSTLNKPTIITWFTLR